MRNIPATRAQVQHLKLGEKLEAYFPNGKTRKLINKKPNTGSRKITRGRRKTYMIMRESPIIYISTTGNSHKIPGKQIGLIRA